VISGPSAHRAAGRRRCSTYSSCPGEDQRRALAGPTRQRIPTAGSSLTRLLSGARASRLTGVVLVCVLAVLLGGCEASNEHEMTTQSGPSTVPTASQPVNNAGSKSPVATRSRRARRSHATAARVTCHSAAQALRGVYHPSRLELLDPCRHAVGTVAFVKHEQDGDLHIDLALDPAYRGLLDSRNETEQHGDLVVEFIARDGGHLPAPHTGQRLSLRGAWVDDLQHGWNELHPVWAAAINGGPTHVSGPQFGGSPEGDSSYDAAGDCRTPVGSRCSGYAPVSEPPPPRSTPRHSAPSDGETESGSCEPGYSPCLPRVADLDCDEIPADKKPVRVTGSDPYRLDADHNGIGCQSG
jgi:hypothetical protein